MLIANRRTGYEASQAAG